MTAAVVLDPRFERTQGRLNDSLFALLGTGATLNSLSVAQIVQKAGVTRSTFYLHYRSKEEFIHEAFGRLRQDLFASTVTEKYLPGGGSYPVVNLTAGFQFLTSRASQFEVMVRLGDIAFRHRIEHTLMQKLDAYSQLHNLPRLVAGLPLSMVAAYSVIAAVGMAVQWLSEGMLYAPDYMAKAVRRLVTGSTQKVFSGFFIER